jgi:hypothetical protein
MVRHATLLALILLIGITSLASAQPVGLDRVCLRFA